GSDAARRRVCEPRTRSIGSRSRPRSSGSARGGSFSGRSTRWRFLSPCGGGGRSEADDRFLLAEQLEALEQARRHLRARHGEPERLKRLARLQARPLRERAKRRLDLLRAPRLDGLERIGRRGEVG